MALAQFFDKAALAAASILREIDPKRFAETLESQCIAIAWSRQAEESPEGRTTLELTVNLSARLYPQIALLGQGDFDSQLRSRLSALARSINPEIAIGMGVDGITQAIAVGEDVQRVTANTVFLGSEGWTVRLSRSQPQRSGDSANPFGAAAAACVGMANVFRSVFAEDLPASELDTELQESILGLDRATDFAQAAALQTTDIGEVSLIGAGAVGQAAMWVLLRAPGVYGTVHIVDPEELDLSNLQRYLLATMEDIGTSKVDLVRAASESVSPIGGPPSALKCEPWPMTWGNYLAGRPRPWRIQRVLVAVDSAEDRIAVQASLPKRLFNAWTQSGDLGISVHESLSERGCLACIYLPTGPRKNLDQLVAEAVNLPQDLSQIRQLLATGEPIGMAMAQRIAEARGVPVGDLVPFADKSMRVFYAEAVCAGILLRLGGQDHPEVVEVPMAFQSAFAGVLLAAALVTEGLVPSAFPVGTKRVWDLLRGYRRAIAVPLAKSTVRKCICQDPDFVAAARQQFDALEAPI